MTLGGEVQELCPNQEGSNPGRTPHHDREWDWDTLTHPGTMQGTSRGGSTLARK